jgi:hypothetical protein
MSDKTITAKRYAPRKVYCIRRNGQLHSVHLRKADARKVMFELQKGKFKELSLEPGILIPEAR